MVANPLRLQPRHAAKSPARDSVVGDADRGRFERRSARGGGCMMTIVVGRYEVRGRPDPLVEQIRVDMLRPQIGDPELAAPRAWPQTASRLAVRRAGSPAVQAQPSLKPAIALDQVVGEIPGQRDPEDRADQETRRAGAIARNTIMPQKRITAAPQAVNSPRCGAAARSCPDCAIAATPSGPA